MAYIFLDESGDLGFDFDKEGTSDFFTVTLLFLPNGKRPFEKIVKRVHATIQKKRKRKIGVLHAVNEKPTTRICLLKRLVKTNCIVMVIYLNKHKVYTKLKNEKQVLYNYVTNILLDRIYSKKVIPASKTNTLIASRRETNKFLNENFKGYLQNQVGKNHKAVMKIEIKTPHEEKCLQIVDFISWAIFRKYERKDRMYYNLIKNKIIEENGLFP